MKATNELQLGDIVAYRDEPTTPIRIWQINANGDALAIIGDNNALDEITIDDEIVGYPLTPEILEKNGFKNMEFFGKCEVGNRIILYVPIIHKEHTDIDVSIEYVHELQHALKLCGIDKEIVI